MNLIIFKNENNICVLLVNTTRCLNSIKEPNVLYLMNCISLLAYNNKITKWIPSQKDKIKINFFFAECLNHSTFSKYNVKQYEESYYKDTPKW